MAVTAAKSVMAFRVLTMAVDLCRLTTRTMNVNAGHERTSKARIIHQIQLIRGITDAAIETDVPGFGIELLQNGQRFKLNTPLSINATDFTQKPKLEAVPVKASDAVLNDGSFSAYATLRVDYQ